MLKGMEGVIGWVVSGIPFDALRTERGSIGQVYAAEKWLDYLLFDSLRTLAYAGDCGQRRPPAPAWVSEAWDAWRIALLPICRQR